MKKTERYNFRAFEGVAEDSSIQLDTFSSATKKAHDDYKSETLKGVKLPPQPMPDTVPAFNGLKIIVVSDFVEVDRTWRERYLEWPPKPWIKKKLVPNPGGVPDGEYWERDGVVFCNRRMQYELQQYMDGKIL